MTSFFYYFQMESFQFSKFRYHSVGRSFQYASEELFTYNNTSSWQKFLLVGVPSLTLFIIMTKKKYKKIVRKGNLW